MKLIYAYIKQFRNIFNQDVRFSDEFDVSYDFSLSFPDALTIEKNEKPKPVVFDNSRLNNVHIIVGKTGSGKTNILQLVGMTEDERLRQTEPGDSYFLLYEENSFYLIEPFNISIDSTLLPQEMNYSHERLPDHIKEKFRLKDSMLMFKFSLDGNGKPKKIAHIQPTDLQCSLTYVFSGFDKHAFASYPYSDDKLKEVSTVGSWMPRFIAEYHKTALWSSCSLLKEYVEEFAEGSIKRKAAFVIENHNWADKIKQHIGDDLEDHDYWTFIGRSMKDELDYFRGEKVKKRKQVSIKHQFIHDLWTDYALYLRRWISYIQTFPEEIPEENLDASSTADVYQEFLDYYFEKEQEESGDTSGIDPTVLPDFENISILKRIEWLSMYIDRKGDGVARGLLWQIYTDIKDIGFILGKFDDKYFTSTTFTMPVMDMYTDENKILVEDLFERMEMYRPDDTGIFTEMLLPYHFAYISSGEYQFAKVLGSIEEYCVKLAIGENSEVNSLEDKPNILYLFDEPETYMHPELCRTFMSRLDSVLKRREAKTDVQIIISTHSPLILSDVLPSQITRLDVNEKGYCIVKDKSEKGYFGANIHTILSDGFFLDFTIGEYARVFLQQKMDWLNGLSEVREDDKQEFNKIKSIVPLIGDAVIRGSFEQKLRQLDDQIE